MQLKIVRFVPESNGRWGQLHARAVAERRGKVKTPKSVRWQSFGDPCHMRLVVPDRQRQFQRLLPYFKDAMSITNRYFTSLFRRRSNASLIWSIRIISMSHATPC